TNVLKIYYYLFQAEDGIRDRNVTGVQSVLFRSIQLFNLLEQSWQNLEIIIVDDASPGRYHNLFKEIEQLDPRILVVHQKENAGKIGRASCRERNRGKEGERCEWGNR